MEAVIKAVVIGVLTVVRRWSVVMEMISGSYYFSVKL